MENLGVTSIINNYHVFDKDFWLGYKTVQKLMSPQEFEEIKMSLLKRKKIEDSIIDSLGREQYEVEKELLNKEWTEKNEESKRIGTEVHERIHNMFCTSLNDVKTCLQIPTDLYNVIQTDKFLQTESGLFPEMRLEMKLDDDFLLVGIADLVIKNGNHISIIDWKSNDQIKFRSMYDVGKQKTKKFKFPLSHLEDCDGVRYQLQLSIYALMIENLNPDFQIDKLSIVQIKDLKKHKSFDVEYLKKDVKKLLNWHVKNIHVKREMEKCNLIQY